jgi:hypothetical protein
MAKDQRWDVFGWDYVWLATFNYEKDAHLFKRMHEAWYYRGKDKKHLAEQIMRGDQ